jgi:peptidoglycan/xylan/chitin deacetylase (PgdA/CDA1 family)
MICNPSSNRLTRSKRSFLFPIVIFVTLILVSFSPVSKITIDKNIKEVVCFVYHRVGDHRYPTTNTSTKDFESHLSYLTSHGFKVLNFSEAIDYLKSDGPAQKIAVITIDDGYKSFYKNGYPLLKKYKFPATLFINTESVGGGDMMSWEEIETVSKNAVEIGNHTHSHAFFLNKPAASRHKIFRDEIELSQKLIKEHLGITPEVFTYPYGEFDPEMKKIVKELGFKAACAQNSGVVHSNGDLFMCPRFPMSESYSSISQFSEKANMKALRVTDSNPNSFLLGNDKRPVLKLTVDTDDLRTNQFQCFIQGGSCDFKVISKTDNSAVISLQANKALSGRRRTLYTVTVPDKEGKWHWYSHVWINPGVADSEK